LFTEWYQKRKKNDPITSNRSIYYDNPQSGLLSNMYLKANGVTFTRNFRQAVTCLENLQADWRDNWVSKVRTGIFVCLILSSKENNLLDVYVLRNLKKKIRLELLLIDYTKIYEMFAPSKGYTCAQLPIVFKIEIKAIYLQPVV
jgi:hypothetical protein